MFAVNTLTLHRGQFRDILMDSHADYVIWVRGAAVVLAPRLRNARSGGDNNKS